MVKKLLTGVALCALTTVASAADLPSRSQSPALAAPAFTWAGAYVGLVAGAGQNTHNIPDYYYANGYGTSAGSGFGVTLGGTLGYNFQSGNFVYGLEGDYSWSNLAQKDFNDYYAYAAYTHTGSWRQVAMLRARAGLAVGNTLAYFTGGLAMVDVKAANCYEGVANGNCIASSYTGEYDVRTSGWKTGFAAGGGIEHAFTRNVTLKAEYLYIGLGQYESKSEYYTGTPGYNMLQFSSSSHLARLGVNYKF